MIVSVLTDCINCTAGVKQGDVCCPLLFSFVCINELTLEIINSERHGAKFTNDLLEIRVLLLADDAVLMSETVIGLHTQLNSLHRAAVSLQLKVNMTKSYIIVLRKGGYLAARERWTPVVNVYRYLVISFSTCLSFVFVCKDHVCRAKNALLCIMKKLVMLDSRSFALFVNLFDSQIQPTVLYGAELWGLDDAAVQCENI